MNYKLTSRQFSLLCEALRRHTRFNLRSVYGTESNAYAKPLTEAWTGLGTYTTYKPAYDADLMTYATGPNPGYVTWWKLTNKGAAIVQQWLDQGYTYKNIEDGRFPCRVYTESLE